MSLSINDMKQYLSAMGLNVPLGTSDNDIMQYYQQALASQQTTSNQTTTNQSGATNQSNPAEQAYIGCQGLPYTDPQLLVTFVSIISGLQEIEAVNLQASYQKSGLI